MVANMNKSLRIMIALDLSKMDKILIQYVNYLTSIWKVAHIDFIHNIKQTELHNIYEEIADENIVIDEVIERELQREIKKHYTGSANYDILVAADTYTESIFSYMAKKNKSDIVIVGKKSKMKGTGGMAQKLVRMLTCDMLLVPENVKNQLKNILLPTDFTANSVKAFRCARTIQKQNNSKLYTLHVYNIPSVYFPFIDREKAMDKTEAHLEAKYLAFCKRNNIEDVPFTLINHDDLSVVEAIVRHSKKEKMDMIVVSARGGNKITSLFIGSITNELVLEDIPIPILVVK